MAKAATAAELRNLSGSELNTKVTELKEELFTLRRPPAARARPLPAPYAKTSRGSTRC
jgi:ribosomal protein L29